MKTKQERQDAAKQFIVERSKRSPKEQWQRLDAKFGVYEGARKERKRLLKQMGAPVCEYCEGKGCSRCHYSGYFVNFAYGEAPNG